MYNSVFETSSYSERGLRFFLFLFFYFLELEFHLNFFKKLEFHELQYFTWSSSSKILFFFYFSVRYNSIVQKSSFKLKLDFQKIEFQNRDIFLNSFRYWAFYYFIYIFFFFKGQKPIFTRVFDIKLLVIFFHLSS